MTVLLHPFLALGLAGLFGSLALAGGIVAGLRWVFPDRDYRECHLRVRTWWSIVALFAAALLLGRAGVTLLVAWVSFLALREYLSLVPLRRCDHPVLLWAYAAIPLQATCAWYGSIAAFHSLLVLFGISLLAGMVLIGETRGFLQAAGTLVAGLLLTVYAPGQLALLASYVPPVDGAGWAGLLFYVVVLTETNDVAQYVWGRSLGRTPMLPRVSPAKTAGGLFGGLLTTLLLAIGLAPWVTPLGMPASAAAGLLVGVGGFFGDALFSALKRDLGVKDTGRLLPGHGGVLDRLDSLIVSGPLFVHTLPWMLP